MRVVLRIVALWLSLFILVPFLFLAWHFAGMRRSPTSTALELGKAIGLSAAVLAFILLGVFAIHRLWHFRESGRRAAAAVFGIVLLTLIAGQGIRSLSVTSALYAGLPLLILLSPPAKRACV